ncbi:MAG TPA: leucine-rich repeat domain-containing protein, partial [Lentisphaeria bacterium]|nr:leucine-rich repeat domain-containing protein [Lentisphaeria bacterium]
MDANYEESNRRQSSQRHNLMLKISTVLFAWAAKIFQGASNSCAQWAGAFIFAVALGAMPSALAETDGFYTYSIDNQKAIITKYQGPGGDVVIPSSINGYPVTCIEKKAFSDCSGITSIVIPDNVTGIGAGAFLCCSSLISAVLPDSVTSIGAGAFFWCSRLSSIVIPRSVTSIGDLTFSKCENLTSVVLPGGVTSIGAVAFYKCSRLSSIVIPDSVTSIGNGAFSGCTRLTSVVIPASVTSIGVSPFADCSTLAEIVVESANPSYSSCGGILFDKNQTTLIQYPAGKSGGCQISDS